MIPVSEDIKTKIVRRIDIGPIKGIWRNPNYDIQSIKSRYIRRVGRLVCWTIEQELKK